MNNLGKPTGRLVVYEDGDMWLYRAGSEARSRAEINKWAAIGTELPEKYMVVVHTMLAMPEESECEFGEWYAFGRAKEECTPEARSVEICGFSEEEIDELKPLFTEEVPHYNGVEVDEDK